MKFSEVWLREWVNPAIETEALIAQLTMAGLEIDGIEPAAEAFSGVVVGQIMAVEQHPDADKLRVCQVAGNGDEWVQVVCGAPNAREGIKIPFATVGAVLPGNFKIKKAKLRGVESFGMLCAQTELQLGDDDSGLWELAADAPVGRCLRDYLALDDNIIEVDLTPNRGDCLSIQGLAREVGVLNQVPVSPAPITAVSASIDDLFPTQLQAADACPVYASRVIRGVNTTAETPVWIKERLRRAGVRAISPAVDVTNYVMLELGQPMHAFDLDKLNGGIVVRMAHEQETLLLLDGTECQMKSDTLVIADHQSAIAMAGIMGGELSSVTDSTSNILLESAFFNPLAIAGKARNYGLHTDSSHRFERGVDPQLQVAAIERATELVLAIMGGTAGPVNLTQNDAYVPTREAITLRKARLEQQLGMQLPNHDVTDMLQRLGLNVTETEQGWSGEAPSWRFDIAIEQDLIEEVARVYGYNNLPTSTPLMTNGIVTKPESQLSVDELRQPLLARGYNEAISYSFVDPNVQNALGLGMAAISLQNPISADMADMRLSLWSGLIQVARYNLNRQQQRIRLFETGLRFLPDANADDGMKQETMLAGLICGPRHLEGWANDSGKVDFFDLKADVEALLAKTGAGEEFNFEAEPHTALHPGQSAVVKRNGEVIGYIGMLHPAIQKQLDVSQALFLFELNLNAVVTAAVPVFSEISKFPEVRRDLAFFVADDIAAGDILAEARKVAGELLVNLNLFDLYRGKDVENTGKSVALGLTFRHSSRTLSDEEVSAAVNNVVTALHNKFQATLRA